MSELRELLEGRKTPPTDEEFEFQTKRRQGYWRCVSLRGVSCDRAMSNWAKSVRDENIKYGHDMRWWSCTHLGIISDWPKPE
jgi:hypothetical protein